MKTTEGDLIELAQAGKFDVIVHGCNCWNTMGSGIAKQIAKAYPRAAQVDSRTTRGGANKLGKITTSYHDNGGHPLVVVNAYTQLDYGRNAIKCYVDYVAIEGCFDIIGSLFPLQRIGYPKIGAGLANGDWDKIADIIESKLRGLDHTLVVRE